MKYMEKKLTLIYFRRIFKHLRWFHPLHVCFWYTHTSDKIGNSISHEWYTEFSPIYLRNINFVSSICFT